MDELDFKRLLDTSLERVLTQTREHVEALAEVLRAEMRETRTDLGGGIENVRAELIGRIDDVRAELGEQIQTVRAEVQTTASDIRAELREGLDATALDIRTELRTTASDIRAELQTTASDVRTELREGLADTRAEFRQEFGAFTEHLDAKIELVAEGVATVNEKLDRTAAELRAEMREGFATTHTLIHYVNDRVTLLEQNL